MICIKCKKDKDENDFSWRNKQREIKNSYCKKCKREYNKIHYENNFEKYREKSTKNNKIYKKRNKEYALSLKLSLKCKICGEDHPACLDFHHRDSDDKEYNISIISNSSCSIKKLKKEIEKCDVLCSNCHRKLHYEMRTVRRNHAPVV